MTFNLFIQKVKAALDAYFGDNINLDIQKVTKNNGIELTGIIIREKDNDVASTIYLDQFFSGYEDGVTMGETIRKIVEIYEDNKDKRKMDLSFFYDYSKVRTKLSCRLINRTRNAKMLERVPYRVMENLAMIYQCTVIGDEFGCASVVIEYSHLRFWQVTEEQIFRDALINMPIMLPPQKIPMRQFLQGNIRSMLDAKMEELRRREPDEIEDDEWEAVLDEISKTLTEECSEETDPMCILTNCHKFYGAAVVLYPGLLERMADEFSESFFILPSSVHEVILLAETGYEDADELKKLVHDVNRTNVSADEFLSDDVYYYRKGDGFIRKL